MILEVGCGTHRLFTDSVAVDIIRSSDADVICDAQYLPFKDNTFKSAIMMEVLEHIPNPVQALKDIHRVANSVVVTVPNAYWYRRFLRWTVKKTVTVFHEHLYNWTLPELTNLLQYAGFKVAYYGFTNLVQWHKPSMLSPILSHVTMQILVVKAVRHHVSMVQG